MSDTTELLLLMFVLLFATVSVFVLLPLGLLTIFMNYAIVIRYYINGKQSSTVPMFGSIFAGIGLAWFPWYDLWHYWYVPFLVDFTWIFMLIYLLCFCRQIGSLVEYAVRTPVETCSPEYLRKKSSLLTLQDCFSSVRRIEIQWDTISRENCFNLYMEIETKVGNKIHLLFYEIDRLVIKQPQSSNLLFEMMITEEDDKGPFREKRYHHIYDDSSDQWIDFYCVDYDFTETPIDDERLQ